MTTIGKVAYVATWDASQLTKGVMTSRQVFSAQKKIVESMRTPLDRYVLGLENLQKVVGKYPDVARHQVRLEQELEKQYLKEAKAIRVLTAEENRRLTHLTAGERSPAKRPRRTVAEIKAENDAINRQRGLAERERIRRLTVAAEKEAAIGRKALQERLKVYKAEKAANEKRLADQQKMFDRQLSAARSAMRQRDQMRRQELARTMKYHSDERAWMTAGGGSNGRGGMSGGMAVGLGMRAMGASAGAAAVGSAAASGVGLAIAFNELEKASAPYHRQIERTQAALNVFTGSMGESAAMMETMRKLSADTGVSFSAFNEGARTMLQFGTSVEDVLPRMRQIAIVTGGNADHMKSLSLAMAQTTAAGKLQGQEVLQMVNAGWAPWEELNKRLNKSVPELRKEMERGNISARMVADALQAATEAGGRYHGFLEELEGTSARVFDQQSAAWEKAYADIGAALEPLSKYKSWVSQLIAEDLSNIARSFTKENVILEEGNKKRDRRLEQEQKMAKIRAEVDAEFKRQSDAAEAEKQLGLSTVPKLQLDVMKQIATDDQVRKFEQISSLLNDISRQQAAADFVATGGDANRLLIYLSDEVKLELEKVDALEKQAELVKKRLAMEEQGRELAKSIQSEMGGPQGALVERLAQLMVFREMGTISEEQFGFAQSKAARESTGNGQALTIDSVRAGSQAAYSFLVGVQDRNQKQQMKKVQEQIALQQAMAASLERAEQLLAEIADVRIGSDG